MSESSHALLNSLSLDPQLALFAVAADAAGDGGELGEETLDEMAALVERGGLADLDPRRVWPVLARGLMSTQPSRMLSALTACGALARSPLNASVHSQCAVFLRAQPNDFPGRIPPVTNTSITRPGNARRFRATSMSIRRQMSGSQQCVSGCAVRLAIASSLPSSCSSFSTATSV